MRLSDVSIKNSVFAWMLFSAFLVFGFISFKRMGISQLPDVDFPVINVALTLSGAAPEIMETTVVDAVEDALSSVEGAVKITSVSKTGVANITIEFELNRNIDSALQEVQTKVAQAQRLLPANVDPPVISKINPDDQPILWLALTYEKNDPYFLMSYAKDYLKDRFTIVPGVGDIILGGYTDPALRVWVQPQALTRYHISVNDVLDTINRQHSEVPGGFIQTPGKAFNVRTLGEAKTVREFGQLVIRSRTGQLTQDPTKIVRLGQVARIEEGLAEVYRLSRYGGVQALGLGIKKQLGSNAVAVARAVKEQLAKVQPLLPPGMKLEVNFDSSRFIEQSVSELVKHLVLAVLLTSLVCWVFLGSWTATVNVLLAIPTSILGAFIGLYFAGFTLNTFTLLGLTLAIGIVVDDAIMVLENIFRYNEQGQGRIESAIIGAREITFAAVAATLAIIAIFLPVAFMKGVIGKFFLQYGVTISLAVSLSLLESLTITPMRCSTFVHTGARTSFLGRNFEKMMDHGRQAYARSLEWSLRHRWGLLLASLAFVGVSFYSVSFLNRELTPTQDQSLFILRLRTPIGSSLAFTDTRAKKVEEWLRGRKEVSHFYVAVGGGGAAGGSDTNTGFMFVTLKDRGQRGVDAQAGHELSQQEFMGVARRELSKIPDLKVFMQDLSARGFSTGRGYPVEFVLQGPDWQKLAELDEQFREAMRKSGLMIDVDSDYLAGMPEIQIVPDRRQAALHGVSVEAIGNTVNALIGGVRNGQYTKSGRRYDIYVQLEKQQDPRQELQHLFIGNDRSNLVPISSVTQIQQKPSLQQISRMNRQRAITLYANLAPGASQQAALDFIQRQAKTLPTSYFVTDTGSSQTSRESFQSLMLAFVLGLFVAYMVLATQFNSFLDPVVILMALPFSFSGAFFALLLTRQSLNMYSLIGLLLLMGIVKKNSILLIDFTNTVRDREKKSASEALLIACPIRLRPIIMTSFATIAAAVPSALARGAGSETFRPMALTLIGGVFVSTLLTLYVVPITYSLLDRFRKQTQRKEEVKEAFDHVGQTALER